MLTYFDTARRFPFVLMLGDNLYHDDYEDEFLRPVQAVARPRRQVLRGPRQP